MIYLDYAANTPIEKEVLDTYYQATMKYFANPNASHTLGLQAKEVIDQTTKHIAEQLHVLPEEIIYTSGASEANNLAIKGILERYKHRGKHVLISPLEHHSILSSLTKMQENGFIVEMIPLKEDGQVNVEKMKSMIQEDTILVSVCSVDSELGIRQPIEEIGEVLKDYKYCFFHSDASQAIGKVAIDYQNVDLITIAPHKFYGMLGTGMLIKKKKVGLKTQIDGGKSTTVFRSGTPELAHIVSMEKAFENSIPIMCSYLFVSIAYGVMMNEAGFAWYVALLVSFLIYTGAFQFLLITLLSGGTSLLTIGVTALLMNSRQLFYSLSFIDVFNKMKQKWYMIFTMTDETYAVNCNLEDQDKEQVMFYVALFSRCYWLIGSVLGAVLGHLIPFDLTGIDFCMTALFIIIFMDQLEKNKDHFPAVVGIVIAIICLIVFGSQNFMLPSLIISSMILLVKQGGTSYE